jgi:hypothetical protein
MQTDGLVDRHGKANRHTFEILSLLLLKINEVVSHGLTLHLCVMD